MDNIEKEWKTLDRPHLWMELFKIDEHVWISQITLDRIITKNYEYDKLMEMYKSRYNDIMRKY